MMVKKISLLSYGAGFLFIVAIVLVMPVQMFAASLTAMSDTLSTQKANDPANHRVAFTSTSGMSSGTIAVDFSAIVASTGDIDYTDVDLSYGATGTETNTTLAAVAGAGTWGSVMNSLTKILTLTYPTSGGTAIVAGNKVIIKVGTNASGADAQMTNTTAGNNKVVSITAGQDSGKLAVALVDSSTVGTTGTVPAPSAPSSLSAIATSSSSVNLSWTDNSSSETLFLIERSTSGGAYTQISSVATGVTTYTDTPTDAGVAYSYRVRATNGTDNSSYSNIVSVSTPGGGAPATSLPSTTGDAASQSDQDNQSTMDQDQTLIQPTPSTEIPTESTPCKVSCQLGCPCSTNNALGNDGTTTGGQSNQEGVQGGGTTGGGVSGDGSVVGGSGTSSGSTGGGAGGSTGFATGFSSSLTTTAGISETTTFITNPLTWHIAYTSGDDTPYKNGTFCSKTATNFIPCIPLSAFPGPVYQTSINMAGALYPLTFDEQKQCYTGAIAVPSGLGSYYMSLRTTYKDGTTSLVDSELAVRDSCADFVLAAITPTPAEQVVAQLKTISTQTSNVVHKGQGALQATSIVMAASLVAFVPALVGNLPNAYQYVYQSVSWIFSLFGYKKKRRKKWGVVYDAYSKEPEALVIVRLYNALTKKLVETQVTDKSGRFSFITQAGTYIVKVSKAPFAFPTEVVKGNTDGSYGNIYRGGEIKLKSDTDEISISIPIDPKQRNSIKEGSFISALLDMLEKYGPYVAGVSFAISLALVIYTPNPLNIVIFILNVLLVLLQFLVVPRLRTSWGIVFDDTTLAPLPLATISLFDAKSNKLVRSRLTDIHGRFNFLAPEGDYKILASRQNYQTATKPSKKASHYNHLYLGEKIHVKKENGIVRVNIPMHKKPLNA